MSSDASFCLWNSNCHELLLNAQDSGANIHLECGFVWHNEPACMKLEGLLREVNGREAQLFVRSMTMQAPNPKAALGSGTYHFSVKRQIAEDAAVRVGVYGTSSILETVVGPTGELVYLGMRFSRHVTVRQLRNGKRIPWCDEYNRMSSVLLAPERPDTCNDLRTILGAYSKETAPHTRIIDVSEGGACVCMPEELAMPSFGGDATYLFFLHPSILPATVPPYVFLAKRAGFGKTVDGEGLAVRLRFQEELDWNARRTRLHWINVRSGSPRLRQCLLHYPDQVQNSESSA